MANRSYLYSFTKDTKGGYAKTFDISEQNYAIPILYKILVSANTEIVPSRLFEDAKALVGEAIEGRKRVDAFFEQLHEQEIFDKEELQDLQTMFLAHLDKYTLDYFLFEPTEVLDMSYEDAKKGVQEIYDEIANYDKMVRDCIVCLEEEDWAELGIDFSTMLYYSLGDEKAVAKIEAEYSEIRRKELKVQLAEKTSIPLYFKYISELDEEKDALLIDETVDKIITLNPDLEQQLKCAGKYQNLDKKISLYKSVLANYPNDEKAKSAYYWLADALYDKEDYQQALNYTIKDIIESEEPSFYNLNDIIEDGKFDKREIYETINRQTRKKRIIRDLICIKIEEEEYEFAYQQFLSEQDFLSDKGVRNWREAKHHHQYIARQFLEAEQIDFACLISEIANDVTPIAYYFEQQKEFAKALYWHFKQFDICKVNYGIEYLINKYGRGGEFPKDKINVQELFETLHPKLGEFKTKTILRATDDLYEWQCSATTGVKGVKLMDIAKGLLINLLPHITKKKKRIKTKRQLAQVYFLAGEKKMAKIIGNEVLLLQDKSEKFNIRFRDFFEKGNYFEALKNALKYIRKSKKDISHYNSVIDKFAMEGMYEETIITMEAVLEKPDDNESRKDRNTQTLGMLYLKILNYEKALAVFKSISSSEEKRANYYDTIQQFGIRLYDKQRIEEAIINLQFCIDNFDYNAAHSHHYIGLAYLQQGKKDLAKEQLYKALQLAPKNKKFKQAIESIDK